MQDNLLEQDEELLEALYVRNYEDDRYDLDGLDPLLDRLDNLSETGLIQRDGRETRLTALGLEVGARVARRHRLAERLIFDVFGAGEQLMHERACKFEHILDKGLDESVCTLLGHPTVCPHGKPIPSGPCCESGATQVKTIVTTMAKMGPGETGTIAYLHSDDSGILNKLMALGVVPGSKVELIQNSPSFAFQSGESQFAVDREIAGSIHIRLGNVNGEKRVSGRRKRSRRRGLDMFKAE